MDQSRNDATVQCCADCGSVAGGGVSLKACKPCMLVRYCNADCQRNHWPTHKKECKQRAAELRDEALFKDPPPKEECPICFLPMPVNIISFVTLPPATISSVPVNDYATANQVLAQMGTEQYYSCCGKGICKGCFYSFYESGNDANCPYCKSEQYRKTDEDRVAELMKRVEANDAGAIFALANQYIQGGSGLMQDREKAMELYVRAAELGYNKAHNDLGAYYHNGGDLKKAKFHTEAAAMLGNEVARYNIGCMEFESGKQERAVKHWIIAASAGNYNAMNSLQKEFKRGNVCQDVIKSTLTAYNTSCAEMRSEARDAYIRFTTERD